jgi:hypothetical protein
LVYLEYVSCAEAVRKAGIPSSTATDLRDRAGALYIERSEAELPSLSYKEQVTRKPGSGAPVKLTVDIVTQLLEACTLNKKQQKKLWHIVAKKEGFFDLYCSTIEKKLRARGLRHTKSTKKLGLTDIQKAQQYKIALSQKDWTLEDWRKVIFSDEASIIVSAKHGQQKIS